MVTVVDISLNTYCVILLACDRNESPIVPNRIDEKSTDNKDCLYIQSKVYGINTD